MHLGKPESSVETRGRPRVLRGTSQRGRESQPALGSGPFPTRSSGGSSRSRRETPTTRSDLRSWSAYLFPKPSPLRGRDLVGSVLGGQREANSDGGQDRGQRREQARERSVFSVGCAGFEPATSAM